MKSILLVSPNKNDATSFYRGYGPWGALRKVLPPEIKIEPQREEITWATLKMVDGVFLQRPFTSGHLMIAKMAKDRGIKLWVDYDDALLHVPDDNPTHSQYSKQEHQQNVIRILQMADVVTISTQYLADVYFKIMPENFREDLIKKTTVIHNAFDDGDFSYRKEPVEQKKCVFWRGSNTHMRDLSDYALEIVNAHKKAPDWMLTFVGYHPWFISQHIKKENYVFSEGIDIYEYFKNLYEIKPAVCIVPLFKSVFNLCKSNIAWIEGSFAGAVTLAPAWEEWRKPGCLNFNNQEEFANLLEALMRGEIDFKRMNQESWDYIEDQLFLSYVNIKREDILRNMLETR